MPREKKEMNAWKIFCGGQQQRSWHGTAGRGGNANGERKRDIAKIKARH
jgi:hypothetical protein